MTSPENDPWNSDPTLTENEKAMLRADGIDVDDDTDDDDRYDAGEAGNVAGDDEPPTTHQQVESVIGETARSAAKPQAGRVGETPGGIRGRLARDFPDVASDDGLWGRIAQEAARLERSGATPPESSGVIGVPPPNRIDWIYDTAATSVFSGQPPVINEETDENFYLSRMHEVGGEKAGRELDAETRAADHEDRVLKAITSGNHAELERLTGERRGTPRKAGA
jgi:hypothetical protein